jgi:serine/threonine protein kinase
LQIVTNVIKLKLFLFFSVNKMEEGTEILESYIPVPPILVNNETENCKIIIATGKLEEGYCIVGQNLQSVGGDFFVLPGSNIIIDKISASLFREPSIRAFVAVPNDRVQVKGNIVHVLHPLKKDDYTRYKNKQMDASEVEIKYQVPSIKVEGAYGKIEFHETSRVAVKQSKSKTDCGDISTDIVKEIGIYRLLKEISCLPKLFNFDMLETIKLQFELGTGTLYDAMESNLSLEKMIVIMFRLAKCLRTSASQGLIHCDIKPPNCIISREGKVQIIDWGISKIDCSKNQKKLKSVAVQTLWYRAPEILKYNILGVYTGLYSNKIDIFSLGIMFVEMHTNKPVIPGDDDLLQARAVLRSLLNWEPNELDNSRDIEKIITKVCEGGSVADRIKHELLTSSKFMGETNIPISEVMADLISHMLEINPEHRWTYDQIIIHPLFQNMRREAIPKLPIFINNMPVMDLSFWKFNRTEIFTWMKNISVVYRKSLESLCLSWQLMDIVYKSKIVMVETYVKRYSCACLLIASKIYDYNKWELEDLKHESYGGTVTKTGIICSQQDVMSVLNGNVIIPTLYTYVSHYIGEMKLDKDSGEKYLQIYLRPDIYNVPFSKNNRWQELILET